MSINAIFAKIASIIGLDGSNNITTSAKILPNANNTIDLGSASFRWANVIANNVTVTTVTANNSSASGGQFSTSGSTTFTIGNGANAVVITDPGSAAYLVMLCENIAAGYTGLFMITSGNLPVKVGGSASIVVNPNNTSLATLSAGQAGFEWDLGTNFRIYNNIGATSNWSVMTIRIK